MGESEHEPPKRFQFSYGFIMFRTNRFQKMMDRLGRMRISKPVGWFLLYVMPVAAAVGLYLFLTELAILTSTSGAAVSSTIRSYGPLVNLGLPGLNPYLPVVDGWIALLVAMVIHEGAHGVVARSLGLPVKSAGLVFLAIIPIAAFVEVDEDAVKAARSSHAMRMLGAGAGINFVFAILCLVLLATTVSTMSPLAQGAGVTGVGKGTPAYTAGIRPGDIITSVNGQKLTDLNVVLGENTTLTAGQKINVTLVRDGQILQFNGIELACCDRLVNNMNQTIKSWPYLGVSQITGHDLALDVSRYSTPLSNLLVYTCVPTLPFCQSVVPFSDSLSSFYTSPSWLPIAPLANLLYWMFFLNLNLAIFNALPIYPLDGGQTFRVGVKALGRGRLSEKALMRITAGASIAVAGVIVFVIVAPYLYLL